MADGIIKGMGDNQLDAQFSQQEEREADDYGFAFVRSRGHDGEAAVTALQKLAGLGAKHHFLSSHPAPEKRARRLRNRLDGKEEVEEPQSSGLAAIWEWLKRHIAALLHWVLALL